MTLLKKIQMEKNHIQKYQSSFTRYKLDKTTALLSHLRTNYTFIVGYCC